MNQQLTCEIYQDLMPQCIDGVASAQSVQLVQEHIESCPACKQAFEDMSARTPEPPEAPDADSSFIRVCRKLERRGRCWRRLSLALLALLFICAALLGGWWLLESKTQEQSKAIPISQVQLTLAQTHSGHVVERYAITSAGSYNGYILKLDDGIVYKALQQPEWVFVPRDSTVEMMQELWMVNGKLVWREIETTSEFDEDLEIVTDRYDVQDSPIRELRLGTPEDYVTVYREGDEIPLVDEETEARLYETEE